MSRTPQQVFQSHREAVEQLSIPSLMEDYAEDAILITLDEAFIGRNAIQDKFFELLMNKNPGLQITFSRVKIEGDFVIVTWSGYADFLKIPVGIEVLLIQDDLIQRQAVWSMPESGHQYGETA